MRVRLGSLVRWVPDETTICCLGLREDRQASSVIWVSDVNFAQVSFLCKLLTRHCQSCEPLSGGGNLRVYGILLEDAIDCRQLLTTGEHFIPVQWKKSELPPLFLLVWCLFTVLAYVVVYD